MSMTMRLKTLRPQSPGREGASRGEWLVLDNAIFFSEDVPVIFYDFAAF
jgi:hypothetical protein